MARIDLHIRFTDGESEMIRARCDSELRTVTSAAKSAILFWARFGMWKMSNADIDINKKIKGQPTTLKL